MTLLDLIHHVGSQALVLQKKDGSMPPGHNGPYRDKETPVRNTAHWLMTFCYLYKKTGEDTWKAAAESCIGYLMSEVSRPMSASFWCRQNPEKDFTNGVMGQAWVLEALIYAYNVFDVSDYYSLAEEVFFKHPWDGKKNVWRRVNVDGSYSTPDLTFNHQLWFAAVASSLTKTNLAIERANNFVTNTGQELITYKDGVIFHDSLQFVLNKNSTRMLDRIEHVKNTLQLFKAKRALRKKSVGYHSFNLYAYAILCKSLPNHNFWRSKKFKALCTVIDGYEFKEELKSNQYAYPYNPTGIELAFACEVLGIGNEEVIQGGLDSQWHYSAQDIDKPMIQGSQDPITSHARIYEAVRLNREYKVNIDRTYSNNTDL